jgi:hypothetical protein
MEHFVTLFNRLFLPQGLALHMSMERHVGEYILWILCVDDETFDVLAALSLPSIRLLRLSELEDAELLAIKPGRTIGEYCWTLTPFAPRFVFEADASVQRVTYIDADLWFRKHPGPIFDEFDLSGKQVLITDHAYAPEHDQSALSGQYCVQFMTFTRHGGESVRKWWGERCIEWCFARFEDGKFGDQKYLDDWPERFSDSVHVLQAKERALAPWNAMRFPYGNAVFYHFQGLRLITERRVEIGNYLLPKALLVNVYEPYFLDLRKSLDLLSKNEIPFCPQAKRQGLVRRFYFPLRFLRNYFMPLFINSERLF